MDVLSDILRSMTLRGSVEFRCEASAPWALRMTDDPTVVFHVVTAGQCWIRRLDGSAPVRIATGDIVVMKHGMPHELSSGPDANEETLGQYPPALGTEEFGPVRIGGGGSGTTVLCGHFTYDPRSACGVIEALPDFLHVPAGTEPSALSLHLVVLMMSEETKSALPGAAAAVDRLCEALFVRIVRRHMEQSENRAGVLAAISDSAIGAALEAMHEAPERPWTLGDLAEKSHLSRSIFAARFRILTGDTPMQYLTRWRMDIARRMLEGTRLSTAQIAERVGYSDEAAFGKTFKRLVGMGPGAYRRQGPVHTADASANERLDVPGKADDASRTGIPSQEDNVAMRAESIVPSGLPT